MSNEILQWEKVSDKGICEDNKSVKFKKKRARRKEAREKGFRTVAKSGRANKTSEIKALFFYYLLKLPFNYKE